MKRRSERTILIFDSLLRSLPRHFTKQRGLLIFLSFCRVWGMCNLLALQITLLFRMMFTSLEISVMSRFRKLRHKDNIQRWSYAWTLIWDNSRGILKWDFMINRQLIFTGLSVIRIKGLSDLTVSSRVCYSFLNYHPEQ